MPDKLRVGVVGLGAMGGVMLEAFHRDSAWDLVAAYDSDPARMQLMRERYQLPDYASATALAHDSLDLVAVATPPASHLDVAGVALAANRHVLCEKPLAPTREEAQQLVDAAHEARKHGLVAVVDYQLRYSRCWQLIQRLLAEGFIGEPRYALLVSQHPHILKQPWGWSFKEEAAGGVLTEYGSHCIDILRTLFGELATVTGGVDTLVDKKVDSDGKEHPVDADDYAHLQMTFQGGVKVDLLLNGLARKGSRTFSVHGSTGSLTLTSGDTVVGHRDGDGHEIFEAQETEPSVIDDPHDTYTQPFARLISRLATGIHAGTYPAEAATFDDGLAVVSAIETLRSA